MTHINLIYDTNGANVLMFPTSNMNGQFSTVEFIAINAKNGPRYSILKLNCFASDLAHVVFSTF